MSIGSYRVPLQVLIYCYRQNGKKAEFLFLKRSEKRGGFWQGVTGAPEKGEDIAAAALRELKEETGFSPKSLQQTDFKCSFMVDPQYKSLYHPAVQQIEEYVFLAEVEMNKDPRISDERQEFVWESVEKGMELLKYPNNKNALRACAKLV